MKLQFHPRTIRAVEEAVWKNPAIRQPSHNHPMFDSKGIESAVRNRTASYLSELLMNIAYGNGPLYGARGGVDVEPDIEVKWSKKAWRLVVKDAYLKPGYKFALATGYPEIQFVGWARSEDINEEYVGHPFGAKFIRRNKLNPMETIFGV